VRLRVQVSAAGKTTAVRVLEGEEPFRAAAQSDARKIPWKALRWPGGAVDTLREVLLIYTPEGYAYGTWFYPVGEVEGRIVRLGLASRVNAFSFEIPKKP
jgi:hypothetical protein